MPGTFTPQVTAAHAAKVQVTGGTAGSPANFASFVTADRAGTYDVLDAVATALNLSLDRQPRPVELRALKLDVVLVGTNAGAGDTVDLAGTDAWGGAISESIDVSAGNATYTSAKRYATIDAAGVDCVGFSDGVGTIRVLQNQWGAIWNLGDGQYKLDVDVDFGDGSTSTVFSGTWEQVVFTGTTTWQVEGSATLNIGEISNGHGINGCFWDQFGKNGTIVLANGNLNIAGSHMLFRGVQWQEGGFSFGTNSQWIDSIIESSVTQWSFSLGANTKFTDIYWVRGLCWFATSPPTTFTRVRMNACGRTLSTSGGTINAVETTFSNNANDIYIGWDGLVTVIDPIADLGTPFHQVNAPTPITREEYTTNIHVADVDGANIQGATVLCEDTNGAQVFSVTTDANGDIAEQQVRWKEWTTEFETLEVFSPHKFTITKAGYEPVIIENVTVDDPIVWEIVLPSPIGAVAQPWR